MEFFRKKEKVIGEELGGPKNPNRREFLKTGGKLAAGIAGGVLLGKFLAKSSENTPELEVEPEIANELEQEIGKIELTPDNIDDIVKEVEEKFKEKMQKIEPGDIDSANKLYTEKQEIMLFIRATQQSWGEN